MTVSHSHLVPCDPDQLNCRSLVHALEVASGLRCWDAAMLGMVIVDDFG